MTDPASPAPASPSSSPSPSPPPPEPEPPGPLLLDATGPHAAGARLWVAGLTVAARAAKQQRRRAATGRIVVAVDAGAPPPAGLPAGVELREASAALPASALAAEVGAPEATPADVVSPGPRAAPVTVTDEPSRARAEDAIFAELLRGDLGLVARYLNKPLSFRITRHLLCRLPFTPNQVTIGAALIGLSGCALIATGSYAAVVLGFLLAHLQSVLDGCDGELARVRFQQSAIGEWLDTVVDDLMNLALFTSVGLALAHRGRPAAAALAFAAAGMMLFYNVCAYRELVRQGEGGEVLKIRWWFAGGRDMKSVSGTDARGPSAFLLFIGRRDFFVLAWVALAALGLLGVIALYAFFVALANFVAAAGQLVWRARGSR